MTGVWAVVVIVAALILGCLLFAMIRYRHQEKSKALEMEQWASNRRVTGVANPMYAIPGEDGGAVTVVQDPYRTPGPSSNAALYNVVDPGANNDIYCGDTYGSDTYGGDTYGELTEGSLGYLDVTGVDNGNDDNDGDGRSELPVLNAANPLYDLSFNIPTADGANVVAYQDSDTAGAANAKYSIVAGDDTYGGATYSQVESQGYSHARTIVNESYDDPTGNEVGLTEGYASLNHNRAERYNSRTAIPTTTFTKPTSAAPAPSVEASLCAHESTSGPECNLKPEASSQFCINHTCKLGTCQRDKSSGQSFCDQHNIGNIDLYGQQTAPMASDIAGTGGANTSDL